MLKALILAGTFLAATASAAFAYDLPRHDVNAACANASPSRNYCVNTEQESYDTLTILWPQMTPAMQAHAINAIRGGTFYYTWMMQWAEQELNVQAQKDEIKRTQQPRQFSFDPQSAPTPVTKSASGHAIGHDYMGRPITEEQLGSDAEAIAKMPSPMSCPDILANAKLNFMSLPSVQAAHKTVYQLLQEDYDVYQRHNGGHTFYDWSACTGSALSSIGLWAGK